MVIECIGTNSHEFPMNSFLRRRNGIDEMHRTPRLSSDERIGLRTHEELDYVPQRSALISRK